MWSLSSLSAAETLPEQPDLAPKHAAGAGIAAEDAWQPSCEIRSSKMWSSERGREFRWLSDSSICSRWDLVLYAACDAVWDMT